MRSLSIKRRERQGAMRSLSIKRRESQGAALPLRSGRDGAKPFEVYGFAGSIGSYVAFGAYVIWAYVPEPWLHALGITYYPSRYWAVAIPSYVLVAIVFVLAFYIGLNFLSTPPPQSLHTLFDDYTRARQDSAGLGDGVGDECPIPTYSDIPIIEINARLLGGAFKEYRLFCKEIGMEGEVGSTQALGGPVLGLTSKDGVLERMHDPYGLLSSLQSFAPFFSEFEVATKNQEFYLTWCTVRIQSWWRCIVCRTRFQRMRKAAKTIQAAWRAIPWEIADEQKVRKIRRRPVYLAATKRFYETRTIVRAQQLIRRYLDRRTFRSIRDVVRGFEKADPKSVLFQINRSEAALADKATGLHVRFRLCGLSFPPSVVYKVYTHRPIVDMGSFSPREYTGRNKNDERTYVRCENNEWRPVLGSPLEQASTRAIFEVSKPPGVVFFNSPEERKALKLLGLKKRKRAWLQKLYSEGRAAESDASKVEDDEKSLPSSPPELEDLELVRWSAGLDFDAFERDCWYMQALAVSDVYDKDWHTLGTSLAD